MKKRIFFGWLLFVLALGWLYNSTNMIEYGWSFMGILNLSLALGAFYGWQRLTLRR